MFRKDLWENADSTAKAGIILHEILYDKAVRDNSDQDSDKTRRFNALISSAIMNRMTKELYFAHKHNTELNFFSKVKSNLKAFSTVARAKQETIKNPQNLTYEIAANIRGLVVIMGSPSIKPDVYLDLRTLGDTLVFNYAVEYAPLLEFKLYNPLTNGFPQCSLRQCPNLAHYLISEKITLTSEAWTKATERALNYVNQAEQAFIAVKRQGL